MSLGISYGETQAQKDTFRDYATRIEYAVSDPVLLGSIQQEMPLADLAPYDLEQLHGRAQQYRLDLMNAAGELPPLPDQEDDDGRAGGSED